MKKLILPFLAFILGAILAGIFYPKGSLLNDVYNYLGLRPFVANPKYRCYFGVCPKIINITRPQPSPRFIFPLQRGNTPLDLLFDTSPSITVDYAKQTATGSPLIFGGAHAPNLEHQDAWDKLKEVGVTIIRWDLGIEYEIPAHITLSDYKNNIDDVQNPDKWNQKNIQTTNQNFQNAKKRGMKMMAILSYAPAWLTYSGTTKGVPKDWDVYEDIVKKEYKLHRNYLDYLEIWNEPDYKTFLDLKDTPYTKEEAYALIYFHAQKAVREADNEINDGRIIPIGAMSVSNPTDTTFFEGAFSRIITNSEVDFVTYHNYEHLPEPSWGNYKYILNKYGKADLPVYLTEWNHNYRSDQTDPYHYTDLAISYTAGKLINFLKMGLSGANYFNLQMFDLAKPNTYEGSFGFYKMVDGHAELLPQAKTWRLLSVSMGLGKGESKIFNTQYPISNATGFENIYGQKGMAVVNDSGEEEIINITISNIPIDEKEIINIPIINIQIRKPLFSKIKAQVYLADKDEDGGRILEEVALKKDKENNLTFSLKIPPQSVVGIILQETNVLKEILNIQ